MIEFYSVNTFIFPLYEKYTDWLRDFSRSYSEKPDAFLFTSYLENGMTSSQEQPLFHLLQFLSFVRSLNLNPDKDCEKFFIKDQFYYTLRFPLSQFVNFTGMKISNKSKRDKLVVYFQKLQIIEPIAEYFSDGSFRSYVLFPLVEINAQSNKPKVIEVSVAKQLFKFPYPFGFPKSFLQSKSKNDLCLKIRLIQSLASNHKEKIFHFEEFCNHVSVTGTRMVQIKKSMIQLFQQCVQHKFIQPQIQIIYKNETTSYILIEQLTHSIVTKRIKQFKFYEHKRVFL